MRGGGAGGAIRGGGAAIRAGGCGAAIRGGGAAMRGGAACSSLGMTADFGVGGGDGGAVIMDFDDPFVSLPGDCAADDGWVRWV